MVTSATPREKTEKASPPSTGAAKGYKRTEFGLIPKDWHVRPIGSLCKLINGRGFKPYEWRGNGLPIIRIQNLNGSDEFNYYQGEYSRTLEVEPGELLFACSGSRGTSFGPHIWTGPFGLLNYHTWKMQVYETEIRKDFLFYALRQLTTFIEDWAHGAAALVHVQKWQMEGFQLAVPPSQAEQEAIAMALRDVDAYIASLNHLILKKRALKQGAMDELLTGKVRLPGFNGQWEEKRLAEVAAIRGGGTPSTTQPRFWDGDILWVTPTDITALDGRRYLSDTKRKITLLGLKFSSAEIIPANSILMTSRATIGECAINRSPVSTNQGFKNFITFENVDVEFLYYLLLTQKQGFLSLCSGSTFLEIGKAELGAYIVHLPPSKAEQTAIAAVLRDMDTEIVAMEESVAKVYRLKKGMMADLLTGRIRLL